MNRCPLEYRLYGEKSKYIVVETGIGNTFYDWIPIAEKLSDSYTVLLYHRAGYGNSIKSDSRRTTENIAKELNDLMEYLRIDSFTILAHSFGGLCAQHYMHLYSHKIERLVLIDSATTKLAKFDDLDTPFINKHCSVDKMIQMNYEMVAKSKEELLKMHNKSVIRNSNRLSKNDYESYKMSLVSTGFYKTVAEEFSEWSIDGEMVTDIEFSHDIPIHIVSRDKETSKRNWMKNGVPEKEASIHENYWNDVQEELLKLSSNTKRIVADECDHMIHIDRPNIIIELFR